MSELKIVDVILGNASVPKVLLSPKDKARLFFSAIQPFAQTPGDYVSGEFRKWPLWAEKELNKDLLKFRNRCGESYKREKQIPEPLRETSALAIGHVKGKTEGGRLDTFFLLTSRGNLWCVVIDSIPTGNTAFVTGYGETIEYEICLLHYSTLAEADLAVWFEKEKGLFQDLFSDFYRIIRDIIHSREARLSRIRRTEQSLLGMLKLGFGAEPFIDLGGANHGINWSNYNQS